MRINFKSLFIYSLAFSGLLFAIPASASAHVIVTPSQADVGQELVFSVGSPNERQVPIVRLTVTIPPGVSNVVPTVAPGWAVETGSDKGEISSITWKDGQIPVGQREDFSFSAQVPGSATTLDWKAYQTYADGTVVHWDRVPSGTDDSVGTTGPYSETKIVNDLTSATNSNRGNDSLPLIVAVVALIVSIYSLLRVQKRHS